MYSKGCLAIGWDARQALLDKGESNGSTYHACTVHSMQEVGPATTTKVSTCNERTDEVFKVGESRKLMVHNLRLPTSGRQVCPVGASIRG